MKNSEKAYVIFHKYKDNKEVAFRIDGVYFDHKKAQHDYNGFVENNRSGDYTLEAVEVK